MLAVDFFRDDSKHEVSCKEAAAAIVTAATRSGQQCVMVAVHKADDIEKMIPFISQRFTVARHMVIRTPGKLEVTLGNSRIIIKSLTSSFGFRGYRGSAMFFLDMHQDAHIDMDQMIEFKIRAMRDAPLVYLGLKQDDE